MQHVVGGGISGTVNGQRVALGSWAWLAQQLGEGQSLPEPTGAASSLQNALHSTASQQMQVHATQDALRHHFLSLRQVRTSWHMVYCRCTSLWTAERQACCPCRT